MSILGRDPIDTIVPTFAGLFYVESRLTYNLWASTIVKSSLTDPSELVRAPLATTAAQACAVDGSVLAVACDNGAISVRPPCFPVR